GQRPPAVHWVFPKHLTCTGELNPLPISVAVSSRPSRESTAVRCCFELNPLPISVAVSSGSSRESTAVRCCFRKSTVDCTIESPASHTYTPTPTPASQRSLQASDLLREP
ncbi:unnamed protein product, partial [Pylaiella littoralis]